MGEHEPAMPAPAGAGSAAAHPAARSWFGRWRVDILLGVVTLFSYGYFHNGGTWNQNARFDAILAFVEPGTPDTHTFRIDRFMQNPADGYNTGDWSLHDGHFYANKAPGTTLLGTAFYMGLYHAERRLGVDPHTRLTETLNLYLINLFVSGLFGALGVVAFRRILLALGTPAPKATWLTVALAFGTMLFPYNTQLWGHTTAAAFVTLSLWALIVGGRRGLFYAGLCAGMAVLTDYLAGILVLTLGSYALARHRRTAVWFGIGGLAPLIVFMLYHHACFGAPFALATSCTNPAFSEDGHLFGSVAPGRVWTLLLSVHRGLLVHMPVLAFAVVGAVAGWRRNARDPLLWLCLVSLTLCLVVNSAFHGWHGGATVCARYQMIALPFWGLLLRDLPWTRGWRTAFAAVAVFSALNMLVVTAVSPIGPVASQQGEAAYANPLYGWTYPMFIKGRLAPFKDPLRLHQPLPWDACNLGDVFGVHGLPSLLPLLAVWALGLLVLCRILRADAPTPGTPDSA